MKKIVKIILLSILCVCSVFAVIGCGGPTEFTVTFDGNGGTLVSGEEVQVVESATQIQAPVYEKDGYEFIGWNAIISQIDKDTTVKAQWKALPFTVIFDGNGGTLVGGEAEQIVYSASEIVIPNFVKKGYTLSWDKEIDNLNESTTITAIWTVNQYTLTFNAVDGELVGEFSEGKTATYGCEIGELPTAVKEGYDFNYWQIGSSKITPNTIWDYDADMVARAEYLIEQEFSIKYDLGGGKADGNPFEYSKSTPTFTLNNPSKNGYEFIGWTGVGIVTPQKTVTIEKGSKGELSFNANWKANEYTISFDAKDGTCETKDKQVTFDSAVGTLPKAYLEYYDFIGWYIGDEKIEGSTIWKFAENKTLTAKYEKEQEYLIKYDLNGGSVQGNPTNYSKSTPTFTLNNPTKEGYKFLGWTSEDIASPSFIVTIEKGSKGDVSFKANWVANQYTITFDAKDGQCNVESKKVFFNDKVGTLPICTLVDYEFLGWYLDGEKIDENTIWNVVGDKTLVAEYLKADEFSIIYILDGGTENTNPNKYTEFSQTFTLKNPTKDGYIFVGWTSADIVEPQLQVTIETGSTGSLVFTANWKGREYSLTFDADGGQMGEQYAQGITVTYGEKIGELPIPSKSGYDFVEWQIDSQKIDEEFVWNYLETKQAKAYFVVEEKYTINYILDGGKGAINPLTYGKSDTFTINNPTREGYNFAGWSNGKMPTPQVVVTIEAGTTGELVFVANWTPCEYTLSFDTKDGVLEEQYAQGKTVTYNRAIGTLPIPVKKGYDFVQWVIDGQEIGEEGIWLHLESKTAVATYVKEAEYPISYILQGGSGTNNPTSYKKSDASFTLNNPTREGYDFIGWTNGQISKPQISVTIESGSKGELVFIANWQARSYVIELDAGEGNCELDKITVSYESKIGKLPECQRRGYAFIGWYLGETKVSEDTIWMQNQAGKLVARYKVDLKVKVVLSCMFRGELVTATVNGQSELLISVVEGQTLEGVLPKVSSIKFIDDEEYSFYAWVNVNGTKITESTKITRENFPDLENGVVEIIIKCQSVNTKFY